MSLKVMMVFLQLTAMTKAMAYPSFTSAGKHFVLAIPPAGLNSNEIIHIYLTTQEKRVNLVISLPQNIIQTNNTHPKRVEVKMTIERFLLFPYILNKTSVMRDTGLYNAISIKADALVRAFVDIQGDDSRNSDFVTLVPKESCLYSYYIAAGPGNPYFSVITFDKKTKVNVQFSNSPESYSQDCGADKLCAPNTAISVDVKEHSAWFVYLKGPDYELHNTLIQADCPVFVISGNLQCEIPGYGYETCITATTPRDAWGKEYVVPVFQNDSTETRVVLRFNAEHFPLAVKFSGGHASRILVGPQDFVGTKLASPIVVSANSPFALYLFHGSNEEVYSKTNSYFCLTNVIPIEQWLNGAVRVVKRETTQPFANTFLVSTTEDVHLPDYEHDITWNTLNSTFLSYRFASVRLPPGSYRIFTNVPNSGVMVYIFEQLSKRSCSLRPSYFYQGVIYSKNCIKSTTVVSDGVDNDCDGKIDEELDNEKDDDGDGLVDEDTILAPGLSQWTDWTTCTFPCQGRVVVRKMRTCMHSSFSEMCPGEKEVCIPGPTCPKYCKGQKTRLLCICSKNCIRCSNQTGRCLACKPGYSVENDCSKPCAQGSDGGECIKLLGLKLPRRSKKLFEKKLATSRLQAAVVLTVTPSVILCVVLSYVFSIIQMSKLSERRARSKKGTGEEDEASVYTPAPVAPVLKDSHDFVVVEKESTDSKTMTSGSPKESKSSRCSKMESIILTTDKEDCVLVGE